MTVQPTDLKLEGTRLAIRWSDGTRRVYDVAALRRDCPCAACNTARGNAETSDSAPPVTIIAMHPVGNYAYNIRFSDGHDTGIYTLELLRELGEEL